ncbi:MAG: hypothetical protein A4E63_02601 [Syntrophorhabdus sp. PtaU1.Bin050]|nr:MAG: hypothetical protein A4E63_02601 [Syntrophorhabdus sp. PtaU1.Bin050]
MGKGTQPHECQCHRDRVPPGKGIQRFRSVGTDNPASCVDQGPTGVVDHVGDLFNPCMIDGEQTCVLGNIRPMIDINFSDLDILRNVDDDRSGPFGLGYVECPWNYKDQFFRVFHEKIVFCNVHGHSVGIDLLKGIRAYHVGWYLPGDGHKRDRIELSIGNSGQEIHNARSGSSKTHSRFSRRSRHSVGYKAGALFMAGQDVVDRAVVESIVDRQVRSTGNTCHRCDPLLFQSFDDDFCPVVSHGLFLLFSRQNKKAPAGLHRQGL